ncbi:MAG: hypothetical protein ABSD74_15410 [Rhizomicrobium sp.]
MGQARNIVNMKKFVQGLVYPSILGAILYNALPMFFQTSTIRIHPWFAASELLILLYFSIDYYNTLTFRHYSIIAGICDVIALVALYRVEFLINPLSPGAVMDVKTAAALMSLIHAAWIIWVFAEGYRSMIATKCIMAAAFGLQSLILPRIEVFVVLQILAAGLYLHSMTQPPTPHPAKDKQSARANAR